MPKDNIPTHNELEDLFINNEKFLSLENELNHFNPIKVMKMERMEIRHSAILGWLLTPNESHGLDDRFLKAFLGEALKNHDNKHVKISALEISNADLRDSDVRIEWQNIDLLIINETKNWAFIIENKFHSKQSENQLTKYKDKIETIFGDMHVNGIFLTLNEEEPKDPRFVQIYYTDILSLLSLVQNQNKTRLSSEVNSFINQYIEVLKEANWMNDGMQEIARELYRNHKKAIDYIIEHGANTDFALAAETIFGKEASQYDEIQIDNCSYTYNGMNNYVVSFLPTEWANRFDNLQDSWLGCEKWWAGYPIICWLEISENENGKNGQIRLFAEVGPLDDPELRYSIIRAIEENQTKNILFQKTAKQPGKKYSKFLKNNIQQITDIHDVENIENAIKTLLQKFQNEFHNVNIALQTNWFEKPHK